MKLQEFSWIDSIGGLESALIDCSSPAKYQSEARKKVQAHEIWLEKRYGTKRYHELQEEFISSWGLDRALKGVNKQETMRKMKIKYFSGDLFPKQKSYSVLIPLALAAGTVKMEKDKKENDPIKKSSKSLEISERRTRTIREGEKECWKRKIVWCLER